jgi:hypothetical protein
MRAKLRAVVTVVTTAVVLSTGVPHAGAAKKPKKPKATTTTAAKAAAFPSDACKLLTLSEVTPLVVGATEGRPVRSSGPGNEVTCRWDTPDTLQDVVLTVTQLPPGVSSAVAKAGLAADAKDKGKTVSGIGDFAVVRSLIPPDAEVMALVGKLLFSLDYSSPSPLGSTRQDDVVALAKLAVGRM